MSAYISDTTLMECQRLLVHHYLYYLNLGLIKTATALGEALDEVDAGLSGQPVEDIRRKRLEHESIVDSKGSSELMDIPVETINIDEDWK